MAARVMTVQPRRPKIRVIAMGFHISPLTSSGIRPAIVVAVVSRIGRNLELSSEELPCLL